MGKDTFINIFAEAGYLCGEKEFFESNGAIRDII